MTPEQYADSIGPWKNQGVRQLVIETIAAAVKDEREDHQRTAQCLTELISMIDGKIDIEDIGKLYSNDQRRISNAKARLAAVRARIEATK